MKVIIVGGGGREHALAWKLNQSPDVDEVVCAPGNAGTAQIGRNVAVGAEDVEGILSLAKEEKPGLVVVGPEAPSRLRAGGRTRSARDSGVRPIGRGRPHRGEQGVLEGLDG